MQAQGQAKFNSTQSTNIDMPAVGDPVPMTNTCIFLLIENTSKDMTPTALLPPGIHMRKRFHHPISKPSFARMARTTRKSLAHVRIASHGPQKKAQEHSVESVTRRMLLFFFLVPYAL